MAAQVCGAQAPVPDHCVRRYTPSGRLTPVTVTVAHSRIDGARDE